MRVHSTNPSIFTCFTCKAGPRLTLQPYLIKFYTFFQPEWLGYPGRTVPIGIAERGFTQKLRPSDMYVRIAGEWISLETWLNSLHPRAVSLGQEIELQKQQQSWSKNGLMFNL
jgi:hypothetical protein